VWLAGATDSDFCATVDNMRKAGKAGFAFVCGEDTYFVPYKVEQSGTAIDRHRRQLGRKDANFVGAAGSLIVDGTIDELASNIISSLTVEHSQINILATASLMVHKPAHADCCRRGNGRPC
jgi:hypothetical protein